MNWAPLSSTPRGSTGITATTPFGGSWQENQGRAKLHRTLSDITNKRRVSAHQGGNKQSLLEPKTPARRNKTDESGLSIFDDGAEEARSAMRRPASPPHVRPKARGAEKDCILDESAQMLGIEEIVEADLPPIQDFAGRVSEQDQYWHAFGLHDGPDGFGPSEDLAQSLVHGSARACFEAESNSDLWDQEIPGCSIENPGIDELNRRAFPVLSPSPNCKLNDSGLAAFGNSSSPLLPPMDVDMEIDSASEDELTAPGANIGRQAMQDDMAL